MKYWAISATAIALLLLGVLIGQRFPNEEAVAERPKLAAAIADTDQTQANGQANNPSGSMTGTPDTDLPQDTYTVPDLFTGIATEWRTQLAENNLDGYAILFDPAQREVIIEQCHHAGYIDLVSGVSVEQGWEFCDNVLWASFSELHEQSAIVTDRSGSVVELNLALSGSPENPTLSLSFQNHSMLLIPGSKNDLLQAMENTLGIIEQKRLLFQLQEAQESERRK